MIDRASDETVITWNRAAGVSRSRTVVLERAYFLAVLPGWIRLCYSGQGAIS